LNSFNLLRQAKKAMNPIIFADVPNMSMIRVGGTYYMSTTTMHISLEVPIMKSKDLVNLKLVN
jgi:beta-xylosidase